MYLPPDPTAGPIVMAYDAGAAGGDEASQDVFSQLQAAGTALTALGWQAVPFPVDLDLASVKERLLALRPALVLNLVESLDGSDRLQTIMPLLLEEWRLPFTGSGSAAMLAANDKIGAKARLALAGLSVPESAWAAPGGGLIFDPPLPDDGLTGDWIVKTRDSHASLFLDDASVVRGPDRERLEREIRTRSARHGMAFFAERYVDGREFNLTVLEDGAGKAASMPAAEISFAGVPADRPRIVGYAAKWHEDSPEYVATPRTFDLKAPDGPLAGELSRLALAAWSELGLAGYARVDFRVDGTGRPFILEVNANPCLSPDAGLAAAAERGGLGYPDLILRIMKAGWRRG